MANTSAVYVRMDSTLKNDAESILAQLGISPSSAVQMLYSQIILHRGLPFDLRLPQSEPVFETTMTREEIDLELLKGIESLKDGKVLSAKEVDDLLAREFGI